MRTLHQRKEINDFLGRRGLATLDDPANMVRQIGFLVRDHAHLRQLLTRCEPEQRHAMYESLRPHLRFEAKPLDVYMAEAGQQAEAEKLPTIGADGQLHPFQVQEILTEQAAEDETLTNHVERKPPSDSDAAQEAVNEAFAKKRLWLVCHKCTKDATFTGDTKSDCWVRARVAGWRYQHADGGPVEVCPDCAPRPGTDGVGRLGPQSRDAVQ